MLRLYLNLSRHGSPHVRESVRFFFSGNVVNNSKSKYPERLPPIEETAQRLGFEKGADMYPEYPLDEPPKLWMVKQLHKLKHRPYWEKEAMKDMGLYQTQDISVQMNTPHVNEKLWQVKHLVQISPIRFPHGYPTEEDIGGTKLARSGEFIIYSKLSQESDKCEADLAPMPSINDCKIVDGYKMCNNCQQRRCYKYQMCEKLWRQRGKNYFEYISPKLFNYVDNPKKSS